MDAQQRNRVLWPAIDEQRVLSAEVSCIALVLGFRSSTNLAAAYGVAVTMTMFITTILFYVVF